MALNDLENPIHLPNGLDTANANAIAKAEKVVVTGTGDSVTDALNNRELSLGNPASDGQFLQSNADGSRSWAPINPSGLPQAQTDWLAQTSNQEIQTITPTNINDTVADVLIWRRAALVTNAIINDSGTGLLIVEANRQDDGSFDRESGTAVYDDDLENAYIYVGITINDFTGTINPALTFLEARRNGSLVFSSSLENLTTPSQVNSGQFTYRRTTNQQYHYIAGDVLTVVTRATSSVTEYNYGATAGDFTQNIKDLPFTAVDSDFAARVNGSSDNPIITAADRVKLAGLLLRSTIVPGQNITVLYKDGSPSGDIADYDKVWNASNPVLANFDTQRIVSIIVDNNITVTSVTGGATLGPQLLWIPGKYIYQVTLPAETGGSVATSHLPIGTTETFLPSGFNDNFKIIRANVEQNLLDQIDQHGSGADISSLETKVNALFPLTPDVDTLINWADIYDPIHGAATVDIVDGYSLIAAYKSDTERYESAGITYGTGANVITYIGLTENLHRSFGFALTQVNNVTLGGTSGTANIPINGVNYLATFNTDLTTTASDFVTTHAVALDTSGVTVTANAGVLNFRSTDPSLPFTISNAVNVSGNLSGNTTSVLNDKTLLWIIDGSDTIPFIDITSSGNIRVNNYTPAQVTNDVVENQPHFLTRSAGTAQVSTAPGSVATYTIPNFPGGSTDRSRTLQVSVDIFVSGVDTSAAHLEDVEIPTFNVAETKQDFDARVSLGPLHGNRLVPVTIGYEYRFDGSNLVVDLTLENAPSDITVSFDTSTAAFLNYTVQSTIARVDDFLTASDAGGTYTFSGWQEFILSMRPVIGGSGEQTGYLEVVPAAVGSDGVRHQLNDVNVRIPTPLWSGIEVADDIGFKTFVADHYFRHSEIAGLLLHREEKWAYGLARLQTANAGHSFTEAVDLATGSTIGGNPIGPGTVQAELVVYEALNKTTGPDGLVNSVALPANYANYKYVHITEYDVTNLQFRHAEFTTYILSAGLVDANDSVRLQGNTILQWVAGTRTLSMGPQEILRLTLKD